VVVLKLKEQASQEQAHDPGAEKVSIPNRKPWIWCGSKTVDLVENRGFGRKPWIWSKTVDLVESRGFGAIENRGFGAFRRQKMKEQASQEQAHDPGAEKVSQTLNPQPSTLNPQPSTLNPQPSTLNPQP